MLYELICAIRPGSLTDVKEIARRSGTAILSSGGVVRGITNWGTMHMPNARKRKDEGTFHHAHYMIIRFDSSPKAQHSMRFSLSSDPRLLSYTILNLGSSFASTINTPAKTGWGPTMPQEKVDLAAKIHTKTYYEDHQFTSTSTAIQKEFIDAGTFPPPEPRVQEANVSSQPPPSTTYDEQFGNLSDPSAPGNPSVPST